MDDIPHLIKLMEQLTANSLADENLAGNQYGKLVDKCCHTLVAKVEGSHGLSSPIGTGSLWTLHKWHQTQPVGLIEDVVTDEKVRGKGVGRKIVEALVDHAKKLNCYKVILNCSIDNEPFYEKCGFYKCESEMRMDL